MGDSVIVIPVVGSPGQNMVTTDARITDRQLQQIVRVVAPPNDAVPIYTGADRIEIGPDKTVVSLYGISLSRSL